MAPYSWRDALYYVASVMIPILALALLLYGVHEWRVQRWERKHREISAARLRETIRNQEASR